MSLRLASARRVALSTVLGLVVLAGMAPATTNAATSSTQVAAERQALILMNQQRASAGLKPLRFDARLISIARLRSSQMATNNYFAHRLPDGRSVFALLSDQHITNYGAGEIIAYNYTSGLTASATAAIGQWMNSEGHRALILSSEFNYIGIGVAVQAGTGRRYWTGYFIKGPDRTGAWATIAAPVRTATTSSVRGYTRLTFRWSGGDVELQTLTAGFAYYQAQWRRDGGAWHWITSRSTGTTWTAGLANRHRYDVRVRAIDRAGNAGAWVARGITP